MTNPMEAVPGLVERLRKYPKHEAPHQAADTLEALTVRGIDTAPRDGTTIIVYSKVFELWTVASWYKNDWRKTWKGYGKLNPSHWMPLPAHPREPTRKELKANAPELVKAVRQAAGRACDINYYGRAKKLYKAAETLEALSAVLKQRDEYIEHLGKVIADKGPG